MLFRLAKVHKVYHANIFFLIPLFNVLFVSLKEMARYTRMEKVKPAEPLELRKFGLFSWRYYLSNADAEQIHKNLILSPPAILRLSEQSFVFSPAFNLKFDTFV